ncbi:DUF2332 domain-containing protein [Mesorhizobium sp.]|uniref:DUF2332 domain-containing protein n=1 Tax=Mesorhizobium sp. TaxID=1871066 RepID=UPI000FE6CCBD|nr:DUF2332 domain-containing protein [Mesorhizobium sp.]RWO53535.1 MAG: DUF2332 domain-containing protein [Mesorhizobium sp.]TIL31116.1 MAG: DUF2332 domain-containing protein [Mesorhizobium sp.]TIL53966.1 MAG: DUF2332 domain-containing protein [Mesorhizobium sp.]TIN25895.1 MAG: DUF2332 domain-containing protein [Mesorhizobium sp.]TIN39095.1 MAG: DUF2332 domain-containing protein [Mesorhizobium sp.]
MVVFETSAHYYRFFANESRRGGSPLYEKLSLGIADNVALQRLAAGRRKGQPAANLVFGAVQYLLLGGVDHPLKDYYPSLGGTRPADDRAFELFAAFCGAHEAELVDIIAKRATNTNEAGRSALLLPAFDLVAREAAAPLGLVEIGSSAGLNLNFDSYGYRYTDGTGAPKLERWTDADFVLSCILEGPGVPVLGMFPPPVLSRVGLELYPTDVRDENERRWLKALVWPERIDRLTKLDGALKVAAAHPPRIKGGDAVLNLASALAEIPPYQARCVYHTIMGYQLSGDQHRRINDILLEASKTAPVWRVTVEGEVAHPNPTETFNPLKVSRYFNGERRVKTLAVCDPHGLSMEWKG